MESEEMKAARHIVNGQFQNQMIFRIMDECGKYRNNQQSGKNYCRKPSLIIAGLIELLFWPFILILGVIVLIWLLALIA